MGSAEMKSRKSRGWGQRLRWLHVKSGKTHFLLLPETHNIAVHDLVVGGSCKFSAFDNEAEQTKGINSIIQRFGTENNENINHYEVVIPLLSRVVLTKLVVDLGGVADEAQMMLDSYKEQIRQRAVELVSWIIDSGNERTLGITKGDILNGNVGKKVRCLSATSRAELWTKRYQQQHFQAWRTPAGKPYRQMGDIEMKTPELLRQSFNIEDIELESGKEPCYTPKLQQPSSARAQDRQRTTTTMIDREFKSAKDDMKILSGKCAYIRHSMTKSIKKGASFLEQVKRDHPVDEAKEKVATRWKKSVNTTSILNLTVNRPNRPFTTKSQIGAARLQIKTREDLETIRVQLRYLFWLLDSFTEPFIGKPPSVLQQAETDPNFPSDMMAAGRWNSFLKQKKGNEINLNRASLSTFRSRRNDLNVVIIEFNNSL